MSIVIIITNCMGVYPAFGYILSNIVNIWFVSVTNRLNFNKSIRYQRIFTAQQNSLQKGFLPKIGRNSLRKILNMVQTCNFQMHWSKMLHYYLLASTQLKMSWAPAPPGRRFLTSLPRKRGAPLIPYRGSQPIMFPTFYAPLVLTLYLWPPYTSKM